MSVIDPQSRFSPSRSGLPSRSEFIALVAAMMALTALSTDIMLAALPQIGEGLAFAAANDRQSVIIFYLLGFSVGQLLVGRLSDLYGRKPVFLVGMAMFIGGSLFAALAWDPASMLLARTLQGAGAAAPPSSLLRWCATATSVGKWVG